MTETYPALAAHAGLTLAEILLLARNSFSAAWLTSHALDGFLGELGAYAAEHGASEAAAQSGDASHSTTRMSTSYSRPSAARGRG